MVITLPAGDRLPPADQRALAFPPDGKLLSYVAIHDAVQQLYLRPINGYEAKAVAGTEGATAPFFSPDSQWIGFHAAGKLKKVSVAGGPVVTLWNASALTFGHGASWGDNDFIAFQTANLCLFLTQSGCKVPDSLASELKVDTLNLSQYLQKGGLKK